MEFLESQHTVPTKEGSSCARHVEDEISPPIIGSPNLHPDAFPTILSCEHTGIPLNSSWSFWIDKTARGLTATEYLANLKKVYTVSTIEGFWSVYNNIPRVDEIQPNYSYHLMRGDRRPMWEDEENLKGGAWRLKVHKKSSLEVWRELLLAAIGEQFEGYIDPDDEICGVSISMKDRHDLLHIWNNDSSYADSDLTLGKVHDLLPGVQFITEFYKPHHAHHAFEGEKQIL